MPITVKSTISPIFTRKSFAWDENIISFFNILSLETRGRLVFLGETVDDVEEPISRVEAERR